MGQNQEHINVVPAKVLSAREYDGGRSSSPLALAFVSAASPAIMVMAFALMTAGCFSIAALVAASIAGVAAAVALSLAGRLVPSLRTMFPVAIAVVLVACAALALAIPDAREGFFSFLNVYLARHNEVFGTYFSLLSSGGIVCGSIVFAVLLGVVAGMLCWVLSRLRVSYASLVAVIAVAMFSLRFSLGYSGGGAVLGVGAWLIQCRFIQLKNSSYSVAHLAGVASGMLTLGFALFAACALLYKPIPAITDAFASIKAAELQLRYGDDSLPQGDLAQAYAMNHGDSDCLELSINGRVSDDLLLRGFVGANFDGSADMWNKLDYFAYEGEWKGVVPWLEGKGLVPVEQRAAFDAEQAEHGGKTYATTTVGVNVVEANSKYRYEPYTLQSFDDGQSLNLDGLVENGFIGARSYTFAMDDVPTADVLADASWLADFDTDYASAENVYSAFAKEHYLDVSDEEAAAIREYIFNSETWDEEAAVSEYSVISRVRTMLSTLASYSENVDAPAVGVPFAEWFLGQSREGNSAYFATVATLAFREQGIPARYVEGYRAESKDVSAANAAGEPVVLGAHDAHAWVEIYLDGIGWTPIEVTPGFYTQSLNVDSVIDVSEAWSNGSQDVAMQGESVAGQMDEDEPDAPIELPVLPMIAAMLSACVLIVVAVALAAFCQRAIRRRTAQDKVAADDQAVCVPALYHCLSKLMEASGCGFDRERPLDCAQRFGAAFPQIDVLEYRRVIELHQAYAFGGHVLRPNELRTLRRFNERLHKELPAPKTVFERADRYFLKAL